MQLEIKGGLTLERTRFHIEDIHILMTFLNNQVCLRHENIK